MATPSEYVLKAIRNHAEFTLYRGRQHGNPLPVLAIAPTAERPSPLSLRRLEHEYSLAALLEPTWAARPLELTRYEGRTILVLADPGGEPLDLFLERGRVGRGNDQTLDPARSLRIAINLAMALGRVHERGLIHKDIRPENVLVALESGGDAGSVWLTGFGIASQVPGERQAPAPPETIAGSLPYMSPEQTGRMNRSIDTRSDLYSLGVTLYEMLTGELPFAAADPLEWVHCHIARQPVAPVLAVTSGDRHAIPEPLSAIIMKLLAKNAEERYQTAAGLEADLRRCLSEWESQGRIDPFPLGTNDLPEQLLIPEKLYGREREVDAPVAAFDRGLETAGYAHLRNPRLSEGRTPAPSASSGPPAGQWDVETVVKASQAISSEMALPALIEKLVRIAGENAGAERGLLILIRDGELRIEAEAITGPGGIEVVVLQAAVKPSDLPQSALHYVIRTQESVLLDDASEDNVYSMDEYVRRRRAKSVLCLPIVKQAKLVGVLYLENNLTPGAFTPDRVAVLTLLASQAAISLENARLYTDMQLQAALLQRLPVSTWTLMPDGTPDFVNQVWLEFSGQTLDFVRSHPEAWMTAICPQDREAASKAFWEGVRSEQGFAFETRSLRAKDETYRWHLQQAVVVRDAEGKVLRFVGTTTDIDDQKRAEERIRQSEKQARQLLDLSPLHITELGPGGARLYTNRASLDYYGITLEQWQEANLHLLLHPQDAALVIDDIPKRLQRGSPFEYEVRLKRRDGQYRWFHYRLSPVLDEQSRITQWYAAGTDIDDHKRAEQRLQEENVALREEIDKASMFEEIVGTSDPLKKVLSRISRVAPTGSTVLITGETGTGKELVARAIHRRSSRSARPFVSVNCAVIPRDLIASELFGHEKGAFTGATQRRLGRFELAEGGTIFLDEVGELPAETQIALLRVLQEREFERIGGTGSIRTDARVIAATNRDLESSIAAGTFRSDLFYRLNVFPVEVPPLRKRSEDIPLLVTYFLNRYARKASRHFTSIDKKSLDLLQPYAWPGNIRELQNVIERSVIVSESQTFSVDESWLSLQPSAGDGDVQPSPVDQFPAEEKASIEAALRECKGRVYGPSGAAAKLGIPRTTLESKIRSLKINKNRFKGAGDR